MDVRKLDELWQKISLYDQHMGMKCEIKGPGEAVYKLTIEDKHLSSPVTCHGGVLAGMMDNCLGVTVLSHSITQNKLCSTVEFKVNYINPARKGDELVGTAQIDFKGNRLVVSSAQIHCGERLIAKGMGTFNLYPMEKNDFFGIENQENS